VWLATFSVPVEQGRRTTEDVHVWLTAHPTGAYPAASQIHSGMVGGRRENVVV
jgi:hypothetical protein